MPMIIAVALLLGLFTEDRIPAEGYACLNVKYRGIVYKATKLERTRLTGGVTLTLPATFNFLSELPGDEVRGRVVQLSGYDAVADSTSCTCPTLAQVQGICIDR